MPSAMSDRGWHRYALASGLAVGLAAPAAAGSNEELLQRSDVSMLAPESFRARLAIVPAKGTPLHIEVWRAGETRTLVRFLDPEDRGKYLLKRDDALYFLAPRARSPVKLNPAYRVGAASLDEMLGTRYSRDYQVAGASESTDAAGALVSLELEARAPGAPWPRVSYVVRPTIHRPVRVVFRTASGQTTGSVDFLEWEEKGRPRPRRVRVNEKAGAKGAVEIEVEEVEARPVPPGLFDLQDPTERRKLDPPARP